MAELIRQQGTNDLPHLAPSRRDRALAKSLPPYLSLDVEIPWWRKPLQVIYHRSQNGDGQTNGPYWLFRYFKIRKPDSE